MALVCLGHFRASGEQGVVDWGLESEQYRSSILNAGPSAALLWARGKVSSREPLFASSHEAESR